jgi:hypothetical protein
MKIRMISFILLIFASNLNAKKLFKTFDNLTQLLMEYNVASILKRVLGELNLVVKVAIISEILRK